MDVKEIIKKHLDENGYDGLFYPGECACLKDDLAPCDGTCMDCEPGYLQSPEDYDQEEFDYMLGTKKPKEEEI